MLTLEEIAVLSGPRGDLIDGKAIAVVEAKREENPLGDEEKKQAEDYAVSPQAWHVVFVTANIEQK